MTENPIYVSCCSIPEPSMHLVRYWSDPARWEWFAAGDTTIAPPARSAPNDNSSQRLIWEIGLLLAAPLAAAALFSVYFGA
jgi:hypothetical protein